MWGGDAAFLAEHRDEYRAVCRRQGLLQLQALIARGELEQARAEMASVEGGVPAPYRLMAATPWPLLRTLLSIRRHLRGKRERAELPPVNSSPRGREADPGLGKVLERLAR